MGTKTRRDAYAELLAAKRYRAPDSGLSVDAGDLHPDLFDFQRALVSWALRKGRAALFADTGLGKTFMQLEWARQLVERGEAQRVLVLAPLAVAHQTVAEAHRFGIDAAYAKNEAAATADVSVSNYERLHLFDTDAYDAVVLDESSILKAFSGTTKRALVAAFRRTPYRLACTATPAPNDIEELTNHADFLSVMAANEMRSTFFIADSRGEFMRYRLKGHAHEAFNRFLASWSAAVRMPSDLGFDDDGFVLPPLEIVDHVVSTDWAPDGQLFGLGTKGVGQAAAVRSHTTDTRADTAAAVVLAEPDEAWLVWCGTNAEADAMKARLPDAIEVRGSDSQESKTDALLGFANGDIRTLVTKPGIAGFGMNFQRCARMIFVGLGYSYEQYYQAMRRCWRFGQTRPVVAHVVVSEPEQDVIDVVRTKEQNAQKLTDGLLKGMVEHTRKEVFAGTSAGDVYEPVAPVEVPSWLRTEER